MQEAESCTDMKLSLIDTHCDTALDIYTKKQSLYKNDCHIDLEKSGYLASYAQFFAIWANRRKSDDECFEEFLLASDNLKSEIEKNSEVIAFVNSFSEMESAWSAGRRAAFLAVEDARILGGRIERLDILRERGVKYLTLMWGGKTCIGASHDKEGGLTEFGRDVVSKCFEYGILPDVSHSNEQVTDEVSELALAASKPFIASHSNSYSLFPHTRNLRKKHLDAIISLGGIVGISLCPPHLRDMTDGKPCTIEDVFAHIDSYMSLGAENVLGLGCDLDGTDLPDGFGGLQDLYKIADICIQHGYSEDTVEKIFYKNYYEFLKRNL